MFKKALKITILMIIGLLMELHASYVGMSIWNNWICESYQLPKMGYDFFVALFLIASIPLIGVAKITHVNNNEEIHESIIGMETVILFTHLISICLRQII